MFLDFVRNQKERKDEGCGCVKTDPTDDQVHSPRS